MTIGMEMSEKILETDAVLENADVPYMV